MDTLDAELHDMLARTAAGTVADPLAATRAPAGSLLASAAPLPYTFDQWTKGLTWAVHPATAIRRPLPKYYGADIQCPDNLDLCRPDKASSIEISSWPTQLSFADGCMESDITDWDAHVRAALEAETSAQLAAYLWTGISGATLDSNPFYTESAAFTGTDAPSSDPFTPIHGFARLIDLARANGYRGQLFFHANEALLPTLLDHHLVTMVGNTWRMGSHVVILDAGYPRDIDGLAGAEDDECWVVATGRVEVALGPITTTPPSEITCADPTWEAKRLAFARFAVPAELSDQPFGALVKLWES